MRSERKGTTARVIPVISIAMLFCAAENPDAPWEKYHVTYDLPPILWTVS